MSTLFSLSLPQNVPAPNVSVVVLSAINTNHFSVANFQIQVAVPKVIFWGGGGGGGGNNFKIRRLP